MLIPNFQPCVNVKTDTVGVVSGIREENLILNYHKIDENFQEEYCDIKCKRPG